MFDVTKNGHNVAPKFVPDEDEQEPNESRRSVRLIQMRLNIDMFIVAHRLWSKLTYAIELKDMEAATEAKSAVEDAQRDMRRKMEEIGQKHAPRFFQLHGGRWEPKFTWVLLKIVQCMLLTNWFSQYV